MCAIDKPCKSCWNMHFACVCKCTVYSEWWFMCVKNSVEWKFACAAGWVDSLHSSRMHAHATHVDFPHMHYRCTWLNKRFIVLLWLYKLHSITIKIAFDKHRSHNGHHIEFELLINWGEIGRNFYFLSDRNFSISIWLTVFWIRWIYVKMIKYRERKREREHERESRNRI